MHENTNYGTVKLKTTQATRIANTVAHSTSQDNAKPKAKHVQTVENTTNSSRYEEAWLEM